jgi:Flp pilus assembly protein CpaB
MALARETRTVVAARRRDAYQMLRAAIVLVPIPYNKPIALVAGQPISGAADAALVARERAVAATQAQQQGAGPG